MTYAHVETQDVLLVPRSVASDHEKLASFLIDIALKDIRRERAIEKTHLISNHSQSTAEDDDEKGFESSVDDLTSMDSEENDEEAGMKRALETSRNLVNYLREKLSRYDKNQLSANTAVENWNSNGLNAIASVPISHNTKPMTNSHKPRHSKNHYELVNSSGWSFYGSTNLGK